MPTIVAQGATIPGVASLSTTDQPASPGRVRPGRAWRRFVVARLVVAGLALALTACTAAPRSNTLPTPPAAGGQPAYVASTESQGADFRRTPGGSGERIRILPIGSLLTVTGKEQQVDGQPWKEVRDTTGVIGWVRADSLSATVPPLPTATAMPALPTATTFLPPTVIGPTPAPAGPRPIDTLVPIGPARQPPAIAPLPPAPATRPATPTPIRAVPVVPTLLNPDSSGGLTQCQDGTISSPGGGSPTGGGACAGHGGIAR
jgi:hypothetical protein